MILRPILMMGVVAMMNGISLQAKAMGSNVREHVPSFKEKEAGLYAHMRRHGINREDMAAMRRLLETLPPYSFPHVKVAAEDLLNPGEHYRMEMDEFILTMKFPRMPPVPGNWIWPYTNTRTPDPAMAKLLQLDKSSVSVARLGWHTCLSIFTPGLFGGCETAGMSITYRILKPEEKINFSTPERLRELSRKVIDKMIIPREEVERAIRTGHILNGADARIYIESEIIVINGRLWVRDAMDSNSDRHYSYVTALSPDRMLGVGFGMPEYNYNANPDPSKHPAAIKRAFALMEELVASLRIVNVNDDGSPDPFVMERVETAPLPVREKLPQNPVD